MSLVSGLPYFKVKIAFAPTNTTYQSPIVATLLKGKYLVVYNTAFIGDIFSSSQIITINGILNVGATIINISKTNCALVDSGGTNVIYRRGVSQILVTADNTPIYYTIQNVVNGGVNYQPSTASQDAFYNFFHFVKIG